MVLPVVAYGMPILKKVGETVDLNDPQLDTLIQNMYETMDFCKGVGLAAPQINKSLLLFVIDSSKIDSDEDNRKSKDEVGLREVFINPIILEEYGEIKGYEEGCLSIPAVYGNVDRPSKLKIEYTNSKKERVTQEFDGFTARVIQHEYDHIQGVLFVDKLKPMKKQLIKRRLDDIKKGKVSARYKMIFNI
jgi:peptide deformylase